VRNYRTELDFVVEKNASVYSNGKLRCYLIFKCNFGFENYLRYQDGFFKRKSFLELLYAAFNNGKEDSRFSRY
jgi:hypothetical protein